MNNRSGNKEKIKRKCLPPLLIVLCIAGGLWLPAAVLRLAPINERAVAPGTLRYVLTGAGETLAIGLPALLCCRYYLGGKAWFKRLFDIRPSGSQLFFGAASALTLPCFSGMLTALWLVLIGLNDIPQLRLPWNGAEVALALLCAAVLPALCEEMMFRGVIFEWLLKKQRPDAAVYLTAVVFALLHFTLAGLPVLFFIGVLLGKMRLRFGGLILPVMYHALYNAGALCLSELLDRMDFGGGMLFLVIAAVLFIPLTVLLFWRRENENTAGKTDG